MEAQYSQNSGKALNNANLLIDPLNFALNFYNDVHHHYIEVPFVFGGSDINKRRLNLLLSAAEREESIKVLARPSILSNNNETAEMLVGESLPLQTIIQDTIEGSVRNVTTTNFMETGIHIKVRPSVNIANKTILLDIFVQNKPRIACSALIDFHSPRGEILWEIFRDTRAPLCNVINKNKVIGQG